MTTGDMRPTPMFDATGVPNLDAILGGGLPRGSLAIVVGPPGSGKTTLASQIVFAAARAGPTTILTALSEPTSKLVAHLRTFRFFDEALLGDPVQVISLEQFLPKGLATTGEELLALVHRAGAGVVVIDGFRSIRGTDADPQRGRQFLYDMGSALSVRGTSTLATSEADPRDPAFFPELTTADVLIGMHYRLVGVRQLRAIEAVKVRGGAPLPGLHGLSLSAEGVDIYPRLESRVAASARHGDAGTAGQGVGDVAPSMIGGLGELPAAFGVPGLDAALDGGLVRVTLTLVAGSLGTGKTTIVLAFALAGIAAGEPVLLLGFRETPAQLRLKARLFGAESALERALAPGGGLEMLYLPPVELDPDIVADRLLAALDRTGARRLIIDSMAELERAVSRSGDPGRADEYLAALAVVLRRPGVTSLLTRETPLALAQTLDTAADPVGMIADNVLLLQNISADGRLRRVLSVLKTRFAEHDEALHEPVIGPPDGIRIAPIQGRHRQEANSHGAGHVSASNAADGGTGTAPLLVLVVEDERSIASLVAEVVDMAGHQAVVAWNGQEGLERASERWPALVVTDLMMPLLDGAGMARAMRTAAAVRGQAMPPIILMTASHPSFAEQVGADALLQKPFHLEDLEDLLHRFLD